MRKRTGGIISTSGNAQTESVLSVAAIMAQNGTAYTNHELATNVITLESISDVNYIDTVSILERIKNDLKISNFGTNLVRNNKAGAEHILDVSMEAAAITLLGGADPVSYYKAALGKVSYDAPSNGVTVIPSDGEPAYSLESFEPTSVAKYLAATAVANAQSLGIAGSFEEVWFPTQIVPPGQSGVDVMVTITKIFSSTPRNLDSTPYSLVKTSIIEAIINPSIL